MKLLKRLRGSDDRSGSGSVAKERLRLVLAYDRTSVSPEVLEQIRDEIIAVISRHVSVDVTGVRVGVSQEQNESRLVADIPLSVRSTRRLDR
jgi:cell division topological specificity factor